MSWIRNPSYIFWDNFIHGKTHWNLLPQAFICTSMKSSTSYKKYCGKTTHACPIFHSILPQKFWAIISEVKEKYTEESRHYSMTKSSVLYIATTYSFSNFRTQLIIKILFLFFGGGGWGNLTEYLATSLFIIIKK